MAPAAAGRRAAGAERRRRDAEAAAARSPNGDVDRRRSRGGREEVDERWISTSSSASRRAPSADIKRAYRRLARRYHPGINPGDRAAEALFRRIAEAYETLSDPARRAAVRRRRHGAGRQSGVGVVRVRRVRFFGAAHGRAGGDVHRAVRRSAASGAAGGRRAAGAGRRSARHADRDVRGIDARRRAAGRGHAAGRLLRVPGHRAVCATPEGRCAALPRRPGNVRWARGHMVFAKACAACGGTGRQRHQRCGACAGPRPRGPDRGARRSTCRRGSSTARGCGSPRRATPAVTAAATGDLYVDGARRSRIRCSAARGTTCYIEVPVAVHEAVLGARIEVPSLDGPFRLHVAAGHAGGPAVPRAAAAARRRVDGGRGDLIVEVEAGAAGRRRRALARADAGVRPAATATTSGRT